MVGVGVGADGGAGSLIAWPQESQKRADGGSSLPQLGQDSARLAPHPKQNLALSRLSWPQDGQSTAPPLVYASQSKAIVRENGGVVNVARVDAMPACRGMSL